jgi:hypothetical protein
VWKHANVFSDRNYDNGEVTDRGQIRWEFLGAVNRLAGIPGPRVDPATKKGSGEIA